MKIIAHTKDGRPCTTSADEDECQELREHLENTGCYAKEKAEAFGASEAGEVIGKLHDIGKYSEDFQNKIRGDTRNAAHHAMAGAYAIDHKYDSISKYYGIIIASHHTGLSNWGTDADRDNTYCGKLNTYEEKSLADKIEISLPDKIKHKKLKWQSDYNIAAFQLASYIRMLFSVLVDSDFTDTEEFCKDMKRELHYPTPDKLFKQLMINMPQNNGGKVNEIRARVLEDCLSAAKKPQGLFTLTVPTGGGKTLSSLAFALRHAVEHELRRVIYVIPYTSIIEQNTGVMKDKLGEENVLEHHSGIVIDNDDFQTRWASENWDIPIIVTTNVQFFESLFSNKTTKSRKIHNIAKSVVIFDEAQMLPADYLSPCMAIISELIENYGVTGVLCSATQPRVHKYMYNNIKAVEIANNPDDLAEQLKRVHFDFAGKKTDEEIVNELTSHSSALVIVNSRKHAFALYQLAGKVISENSLFYLSTLLIPVHRTEKIETIKKRLKRNLPVKVISTQLIEAGVDLDFPIVYRSIAGIDNIIQAGGRANREGKLTNQDGSPKLGEVVVFEPVGENGKLPKSLMTIAKTGKDVIECLGHNAFGPLGIKKYFELLYHTLERDDVMDKKNIMDEFEMSKSNKIVRMNFATVTEKFKLIEDNTYGIVIPCDESKELIERLYKGDCSRKDIRDLQKYSVSVYENEFNMLYHKKARSTINGINVLVAPKFYSEDTGLDLFTEENKNAEAFYQ